MSANQGDNPDGACLDSNGLFHRAMAVPAQTTLDMSASSGSCPKVWPDISQGLYRRVADAVDQCHTFGQSTVSRGAA